MSPGRSPGPAPAHLLRRRFTGATVLTIEPRSPKAREEECEIPPQTDVNPRSKPGGKNGKDTKTSREKRRKRQRPKDPPQASSATRGGPITAPEASPHHCATCRRIPAGKGVHVSWPAGSQATFPRTRLAPDGENATLRSSHTALGKDQATTAMLNTLAEATPVKDMAVAL